MTFSLKSLAICILTACLWACTQAPAPAPEPIDPELGALALPSEDSDAELAPPIEAFHAPTPAMLRAALSGDPDLMREAAATTLTTCQPATTCTGYGSCTGWSNSEQCGASCGPQQCICIQRPDFECPEPQLRGRNTFNSYRVCFNGAGQSCTEFRQTIANYCGC